MSVMICVTLILRALWLLAGTKWLKAYKFLHACMDAAGIVKERLTGGGNFILSVKAWERGSREINY